MIAPLTHKELPTVFDAIRAGFETVARQARHVRIREDLIPSYADALPARPPENVLDATHHFTGDMQSTAAYILTLDCLNFGSGYEAGLVREGWELVDGSLYYTISTRVKEHFERRGPFGAADLAAFSPADCARLLSLRESGPASQEFAGLCAVSLRALGGLVENACGGDFFALVDDAGGSADRMVRLLAQMPYFRDVHDYRGREVPFYKRAQITAADLHLAFRRLGRTLFGDIENLTMFPDNGVPHVFHVDGVLEYSDDLAARIAQGRDVPSGSEEEVEIRACAGYLVERIAAHKGMISMDVDHILWHKSVEAPRYRQAAPHRTLSVFY